MKDNMTVFSFTIYYEGDDWMQYQRRYILAESEEEAVEKLLAYRESLVAQGLAEFGYFINPTVELENVIY